MTENKLSGLEIAGLVIAGGVATYAATRYVIPALSKKPAPPALPKAPVVITNVTPADRLAIAVGDVVTVKAGSVGPDFTEFKGLTEEQAFTKIMALAVSAKAAGIDLDGDEAPLQFVVTRLASLNQILREMNDPNQPAGNPMNEGPVILGRLEKLAALRMMFTPADVVAIEKRSAS